MDNNSQVEKNTVSARRRLIKGGFAVPAALTLASGSAMARTSSACIVREANQGTVVGFDANTVYLRVEAYTNLSVVNGNGNNTKTFRNWWIRFDEISAVATAAGVSIQNNWITAGNALCVDVVAVAGGGSLTPPFVSGTIYPTPNDLTTAAGATPAQTPRFYAVMVNTSGNIIGISSRFTASGQSGGAVNTSCWNSFALSK